MQQGVPKAAFPKVLHIVDRAMAIKTACLLAHANDLILIAGKGHQYYEEIKGIKYPFLKQKLFKKFWAMQKQFRCNLTILSCTPPNYFRLFG